MAVGFAIQAATGLRNLPHRPIGGPGVWPPGRTAVLLTGGLILRLRGA